MLGQVWRVSGRNRYYTFPHGSLQKILYCEFPGVWNHSASNPGSVTLNRTNPSPIKTRPVVLLQEQTSRLFDLSKCLGHRTLSAGLTAPKWPQLPWSLLQLILQTFVHLCCIGLTSARTPGCTAASYAGSATQYTVCFSLSNPRNVLTTQGSHWFSHTVALFPLAPSASRARPRLFLHPNLFKVCQLCKLFQL